MIQKISCIHWGMIFSFFLTEGSKLHVYFWFKVIWVACMELETDIFDIEFCTNSSNKRDYILCVVRLHKYCTMFIRTYGLVPLYIKYTFFIFDHWNQMCTSFRVIFNLGPVRLLYNYLLMKFLPKSLLNAFALLVKIIFFSRVSMFFRPGIHHTLIVYIWYL